MKKNFYIGIDIGGTKISVAAVTSSGDILSRAKTATPPNAKPAAILKLITNLINEVILENSLQKKNLSGIGMGVPGVVKDDTDILITPNINLAGFPLCEKLRKEFKTKTAAGNDVNVGLLGEKWLGAGKKARNIVGIFPGTGVGGAIIMNEKLWAGTQGAAGELGHMLLVPNGPKCSCGNHGCLEALAGRWAIERDLRAGVKAGRKSLLTELTHNFRYPIKSKILKTCLEENDSLVVEIMTKASHYLGLACINMRHILNPEMIIFGGGVIEACGYFMLPIIEKTSKANPFFAKIDNCKIIASKLGDDAVLLGGVALIKKIS